MTRPGAAEGGLPLADLEAVLQAADRDPEAFPTVGALAGALGLAAGEALAAGFRQLVHQTPAEFLEAARVRAACRRMVAGDPLRGAVPPRRVFRAHTGLDPEGYRRMLDGDAFELQLPRGFRPTDLLRFHGRDPLSVCERVEGPVLRKAFLSEGRPAVLVLAFEGRRVAVRLEGGGESPGARAGAHAAALRLLGWRCDPAGFEAAHGDLARGREGLRIPLTLDPFEALVWAILGQQVNLPFAYALRREVVRLAGVPAGHGLVAHPEAPDLARLEPEALQARRCSRRKAEYLIGAARAVAEGTLRLEGAATAEGTERRLRALRGCGPWTARYVMMRGLGFADCVPVGDAALTLALQRAFRLRERPGPADTERLMSKYAPYRSLATFHLWAGLKGVPA